MYSSDASKVGRTCAELRWTSKQLALCRLFESCPKVYFVCKCHLLSEALGCQCKWYLGTSPLLSKGTTLSGTSSCMQIQITLAIRLVALGVALQESTSHMHRYHLRAEALDCQCKWYLGWTSAVQEHHGAQNAGSHPTCNTIQ